jgi:hypothetical protein
MCAVSWRVQLGAGLVVLVTWLGYPAAGSAQPGSAPPKTIGTYKQGWAVFTQGGKTDSLPFDSGRMDEPGPPIGKPGDRSADLLFSRDNGATLEVSIGRSGGQPPVFALKLNSGPSGDSDGPSMMSAPCQSKFSKFDGTGIEGTVTCSGKFNTGPPITLVRLSVKP